MVSKTVDQNAFKTTNRKYWIGSIITYLLIPLVLLISGWDLGWWQGWFYSALIIAVIRTALEDNTLQEELPGYMDYVRRVRYRLIPGVF